MEKFEPTEEQLTSWVEGVDYIVENNCPESYEGEVEVTWYIEEIEEEE